MRSTLPGAVGMEKATPYADASGYNNYYEFGTDKSDPARTAGMLKTRSWTVEVEGEVKKPGNYDLDALLKLAPMEERICSLRCVEGWSMVIPGSATRWPTSWETSAASEYGFYSNVVRRSTTRAGARPTSAASAKTACSPSALPR